jgi:hypothetical protein
MGAFNLEAAGKDRQSVDIEVKCPHVRAMYDDGDSHTGLCVARIDVAEVARRHGVRLAKQDKNKKVIAKFCPNCEKDFPKEELVWCMPFSILNNDDIKKQMLNSTFRLEPVSRKAKKLHQRLATEMASPTVN